MASLNDIETKVHHIIDILDARTIKTITGVLPLTFTAKGGTAADWEIRGNDDVGENLFDGRFKGGYYNTTSGTFFSGAGRYIATEKIAIESAQIYTVSFDCDKEGITTDNKPDSFVYFWNESTYLGYEQALTKELQTFTTPSNATLCAFIIGAGGSNIMDLEDVSDAMLVKGSTAPDHYIPYQQGVGEQRVDGYYVPLTISQAGQVDKTVDIYIGDSPLTEGETVSKTSTGVDIEMFEGENTISTTLYNKPEMTIKYK